MTERCGGAWDCVLPSGHNQGRLDIPSNHHPFMCERRVGHDICGETFAYFRELQEHAYVAHHAKALLQMTIDVKVDVL